jgi:hypothetical protein
MCDCTLVLGTGQGGGGDSIKGLEGGRPIMYTEGIGSGFS